MIVMAMVVHGTLMKMPDSSSCGMTRPGMMERATVTEGTAADTVKPTAAPQLETMAMIR